MLGLTRFTGFPCLCLSLLGMLALTIVSAQNVASGSWNNGIFWSKITTTSTDTPRGRIDGALVYDAPRSRVLLFGGRGDNGQVLDDTWELLLDTTGDSLSTSAEWRSISIDQENRPTPVFDFVSGIATVDGEDYFLIATGDAGSGKRVNEVWTLRLSANDGTSSTNEGWSQVFTNGTIPAARYGGVGGTINGTNELLLSHGFDNARFADSFKLSLSASSNERVDGTWQRIHKDTSEYNPSAPHARCLGAGTVTSEGNIAMFGGCLTGGKTGGPCPSNDGWVLRLENGKNDYEWQRSDNGPAASWKNIMTTWETSGQVLLYGGSDSSNQVITTSGTAADELNFLDPKTGAWRRFIAQGDADSVPSKRSDMMMTSLVVGDTQHSIMWGGRSSSGFDTDIYLLSASAAAPNGGSSGEVSSGGKRWFTIWMLHGIFMFLGWGVCLQGGVFVARYFRHKDPFWFKFHRAIQSIGLLLAIVGFALGIMSANTLAVTHFQFTHAILGLIIMIIGCLQPLNAFIRPHPGEKFRAIWSFFHKNLGRIALLLAQVNISLGLFMALAMNYVYILWFVYLGLVLVAYVVFEARMRAKREASAANAGLDSATAVVESDAGKNDGKGNYEEETSTT